jgi:uncharacterized RDD family membrane protein YckC
LIPFTKGFEPSKDAEMTLQEEWPREHFRCSQVRRHCPILQASPGSMTALLATIGDRFTAQFIDGFVALVAGGIFYYLARALEWPLQLALAAWLLYMLVCDAMPGGQSLGKKLVGIAVVHATTELPCRCWQSVVRNGFMLVLGVFDAMFIVGIQRRRLGDHLARTKVVSLSR